MTDYRLTDKQSESERGAGSYRYRQTQTDTETDIQTDRAKKNKTNNKIIIKVYISYLENSVSNNFINHGIIIVHEIYDLHKNKTRNYLKGDSIVNYNYHFYLYI